MPFDEKSEKRDSLCGVFYEHLSDLLLRSTLLSSAFSYILTFLRIFGSDFEFLRVFVLGPDLRNILVWSDLNFIKCLKLKVGARKVGSQSAFVPTTSLV